MGRSRVISISIPEKLLRQLDEKLEESTFNSRSDLIQYLIRKWLSGECY